MSTPYPGAGGRPPQAGGRPSGNRGPDPAPREGYRFPRPDDATLRAIIQQGDPEQLVKVAERIGQALAQPATSKDKLTSSQIRAIFGAVRQIEMSWPPEGGDPERARRARGELLRLKPRLAYQAQRVQERGVAHLRGVLDPAIDLVGDNREHFQNFVDFFEAILAYHRAYGGE